MGPYSGSARHALDDNALIAVAIVHDQINKVLLAADKAATLNKRRLEGYLRSLAITGGLRYLELALGKRMSVNLNLRSQESLPEYRLLPRELKERLDQDLDDLAAFQQGRVIPSKALRP